MQVAGQQGGELAIVSQRFCKYSATLLHFRCGMMLQEARLEPTQNQGAGKIALTLPNKDGFLRQ
jgi:hypothetical protein